MQSLLLPLALVVVAGTGTPAASHPLPAYQHVSPGRLVRMWTVTGGGAVATVSASVALPVAVVLDARIGAPTVTQWTNDPTAVLEQLLQLHTAASHAWRGPSQYRITTPYGLSSDAYALTIGEVTASYLDWVGGGAARAGSRADSDACRLTRGGRLALAGRPPSPSPRSSTWSRRPRPGPDWTC